MVKIACLLILALNARELYISISDRHWKKFAFYTQISNINTAGSVVLIILARAGPNHPLLSEQLHASDYLYCDHVCPNSDGKRCEIGL